MMLGEAISILQALADGIDPETGELLPQQSPFNRPQVIRALFLALSVLNGAARYTERKQSLPANSGRPWSAKEEQALLSLFDSGVPLKEIAQKHGRTMGAIATRLVRLGRIKDYTETYAPSPSSPSEG